MTQSRTEAEVRVLIFLANYAIRDIVIADVLSWAKVQVSALVTAFERFILIGLKNTQNIQDLSLDSRD